MSKMPPSDPSPGLDPEFTRAKPVVRDARTLLLPKGWTDWRDGIPPPEHELAVDQVLAQLAAGRRRILSPSEVRALHLKKGWLNPVACTQTAVRFQLAWYGEVEFQDSITYAAKKALVARRLSLLRRRFNLLRRAEKSLAEYLRLMQQIRKSNPPSS
jgi:hypothetical protein